MSPRRGRRVVAAVAVALAVGVPDLGAQGGVPAAGAARTPADSSALALLERAALAYQGARTLRAEFTQRLANPRTRTDLRSRGEFFQQGATRFAFRFSEPAGDVIVSDGQALWLHTPSTTRGQVLKLPRAAGMGMDLASGVLRAPAERYVVTAGADTILDGRAVRAVRLVPRAAAGAPFTRATLWLDPADAIVRQAEFAEASGLVRTLAFSRVRLGGALPTGVFTYRPPAGVRVIDQAALLGGSVPP